MKKEKPEIYVTASGANRQGRFSSPQASVLESENYFGESGYFSSPPAWCPTKLQLLANTAQRTLVTCMQDVLKYLLTKGRWGKSWINFFFPINKNLFKSPNHSYLPGSTSFQNIKQGSFFTTILGHFASSLMKIPWVFSFFFKSLLNSCCCSVSKFCLTLYNPMDCSTPGSSSLHCLLGFAQIRVHWVGDAI